LIALHSLFLSVRQGLFFRAPRMDQLIAMDVVHTSQTGDQVLYHPLPYRIVLQRRKDETTKLVDQLMEALDGMERPEPEGPLITLRGYHAVLTRSAEMVAAAQQSVFLSGWPEEVERLLPRLVEAEARGVRVWVLVCGQLEVPLRHCYYHGPPAQEGPLADVLPALVVVSDHSEALLASVAKASPVRALWTRNRGVTLIAAEFVKHEILLAALAQRLGPELDRIMAQMKDLQQMWFGS